MKFYDIIYLDVYKEILHVHVLEIKYIDERKIASFNSALPFCS